MNARRNALVNLVCSASAWLSCSLRLRVSSRPNVWVAGSRRYRRFENLLLPRPTLAALMS